MSVWVGSGAAIEFGEEVGAVSMNAKFGPDNESGLGVEICLYGKRVSFPKSKISTLRSGADL